MKSVRPSCILSYFVSFIYLFILEAGRITQLYVDRRRCCVAPSSADSDCGGKRQKRRNNPSKEKKSFGDCMTLQFGTVGVFSFFTLRVDS